MKKILIIAVVLVFVGYLIFKEPVNKGEDLGFYYPDISDLSIFQSFPIESLEQCQDIAYSLAEQDYKNFDEWDYECGFGCNYNFQIGVEVCKETIQ